MMKSLKLLALIIGGSLLIDKGMAAEVSMLCNVWFNQGTAEIRMIDVVDHPEMKVLEVDMKIKPLRKLDEQDGEGEFVDLEGLFAVKLWQGKSIFVSGIFYTQEGSQIRLPPVSASLQGQIDDDGSMFLSLYDEERIFHRGFGTPIRCRPKSSLEAVSDSL